MSEHEQYAEDLALYALDALTGEDRAKLAQHLAGCSSCRLELEQLRGDTATRARSSAGSFGAGMVGMAGLGSSGGGVDISLFIVAR